MKIYTKRGDDGCTFLPDGSTLPKNAPVLCLCGSLDELNSYLGLVYSALTQNTNFALDLGFINYLQNMLFSIGAEIILAGKRDEQIDYEYLTHKLEEEIDTIQDTLPELKNFILPRGNLAVSFCHIARCHARKVERNLINVIQENTKYSLVAKNYGKCLNRLSDYLFVLSRKIVYGYNLDETLWIKSKA